MNNFMLCLLTIAGLNLPFSDRATDPTTQLRNGEHESRLLVAASRNHDTDDDW